jgi:predicted nucleic acid-binding protein
MIAYCDTGVIVKSYVFEGNSPEAIAFLDAAGTPLAFSHFHAVEIPNAIRLKRFRKEITVGQETEALRAFQSDVDAGRLALLEYDLASVFIRAASLSAKHSGAIGTRSMDILHVAAALEAGCDEFVSLDERQRKIAAKEGLQVIPRRFPPPR